MTARAVELLRPGGPVAAALTGYERRPQQLAMAEAVEEAFRDRNHLLVEAGTGVGKSFAYLAPALLAIQAGQRVAISTYTIALQEQLIAKDLPFLSDHLHLRVRAVLGKGRNNYLCRRRLQVATRQAEKILSDLGYPNDRIVHICDCISNHRTGGNPKTIEAKILSVADALSHFRAIPYFMWLRGRKKEEFQQSMEWIWKKIGGDWESRMLLPKAKELVKKEYEAFKILFK